MTQNARVARAKLHPISLYLPRCSNVAAWRVMHGIGARRALR